MAKFQLENSLFSSWLEVYKSVEAGGLLHEKIIDFHDEDGIKTGELPLCQIKANAFDEIYPNLPGEGVGEVISEMIYEGKELTGREQRRVLDFLKKLPTKQSLDIKIVSQL